MKKILFILSLALIIPFTGISQRYAGVQSLYVNSDTELGETRGEDWFGWSLGTITTWVSFFYWPDVEEQGIFNRFEPEDLTDRIGEAISKVSYRWPWSISWENTPTLSDNPHIRVYTGGYFNSSEDYDRGNLVVDIVAPMPPNNNQWQDIIIPPVLITGTEEVWFGVVHHWESGYIFMDVIGENGAPLTEEEIASCYSPLKSDIVYFGADEEYEDAFFSYGQAHPGEISSYYVRAFSTALEPASNLEVVYDEETCNAELTWDAPAENPNAQYNIYRDGSRIKLNHNTTSYIDLATDFNPLKEHTWLVTVSLTGKESPGVLKNMPKCADCPDPINVKAEYTNNCTSAEITWNAVEGATQYIVYRNGEERAKVTENKYTDTDPNGFNTTNSWEVLTKCAIGESEKTKSNPLVPCVGIRDNEITFSIHPNPATTEITIKAGNIFNTVEIVNFLGQTVISQNNSTDNVQIDVSNLNSGVYFVRIASENGVNVQKFVKK